MKNLKLTLIGLFASVLATAQGISTPAPSPGAKLVQDVGLTTVTVEYSRPGAKGRTIFGDLVPYDELWRTGANAATKISFDKDVKVGETELKAGDYAILTLPGKKEWKVNFYPYDSPGHTGYHQKTPEASVAVTPADLNDLVETFTIDISNIDNDGANLDIVWEKTKVTVPLTVYTDEQVMAQIENLKQSTQSSTANNYNAAAYYLLSEKKDLEKALSFSGKAVELRPEAFWMSRTHSLILAELGKYEEAIAAAERSKAAAAKAGNNQYVKMNEEAISEWKKK